MAKRHFYKSTAQPPLCGQKGGNGRFFLGVACTTRDPLQVTCTTCFALLSHESLNPRIERVIPATHEPSISAGLQRDSKFVTAAPSNARVVSMIEHEGRVIVATEAGVFVLGADGVLHPIPFEVALPRGPASGVVLATIIPSMEGPPWQ